jgi:hypothetical protein
MAIADAVALAEILCSGAPDVVPEFERRRRGPNSRSLRLTQGTALGLGMPARLIEKAFPRMIGTIGRNLGLVGPVLRRISVRFATSS